jgi:hypothetical protein
MHACQWMSALAVLCNPRKFASMPPDQYVRTLGKKTGVALKYIPAFVLHRNLVVIQLPYYTRTGHTHPYACFSLCDLTTTPIYMPTSQTRDGLGTHPDVRSGMHCLGDGRVVKHWCQSLIRPCLAKDGMPGGRHRSHKSAKIQQH